MNLYQKASYRSLVEFLFTHQEDDLVLRRLHQMLGRLKGRPDLREIVKDVYESLGKPKIIQLVKAGPRCTFPREIPHG